MRCFLQKMKIVENGLDAKYISPIVKLTSGFNKELEIIFNNLINTINNKEIEPWRL